ncbi:hypothetical protein A2477_00830, partial [Candidatus Falkowbacteria bacterium RIFOXYC2_FULL_47_12]
MNLLIPLHIAYKALKIHKARSVLTVLGLVIGVASIIVVVNMGKGIENLILQQVEIFGTDYLEVEVKVPSVSKTSSANAAGIAQGISITTLKIADAEAVAKHPNITDYYVGQLGQDVVSYGSENKTASLWGTSPSFFALFKTEIETGRPFDVAEDAGQSRVAVLGYSLKQKLFGDSDATGQRVKIGNKSFKVIGVMAEQGNGMFLDLDGMAFLPIRTLQKQIMGIDNIQFFVAYMKDPSRSKATAADVTEIMRDQHDITDPKKDDFAVTTMEEAMGMLDVITGGITLLLMAIAGISLLVGGVGIMNIMYVSVTERTYEIGLRKAIGATGANILWQFLWEALFLTLTGGVIGVVLGEVFSIVAAFAARSFGLDWNFNLSLSGLVLGVSFSV